MPPDESEVSAMEKQALIAHCLTYPNAVEDYPFADNDLTIICRAIHPVVNGLPVLCIFKASSA